MATYYVRKTGDDGNDGLSEANAKLTIASAVTASSEDDTIDIGEGTFDEALPIEPRTYQGAGMFSTTLEGMFSDNLATGDHTYNDMYWDITAEDPTAVTLPFGTLTLNRVFIDGTKRSAGAYSRFFIANNLRTFIMNNCVIYEMFEGNSRGFVNSETTGYTSQFTNCTFYNTGFKGQRTSADVSSDSFYKNCIFQGCMFFSSTGTTEEEFINPENCIFWDMFDFSQTGGSTNCTFEDPLLADPGGGDLRLQAGSPAIGAGQVI